MVTSTDSRMFNGSTWVSPALFIDGDLAALGTIFGKHIAGDTIEGKHVKFRELTGEHLKVGAIKAEDAVFANAAIDTLQLAGQAVTLAVSAYAGGELSSGSLYAGGDAQIIDAAIDCSGAPINVNLSFLCAITATSMREKAQTTHGPRTWCG
ncbi:hypothetical protein MBH78_19175 [Oceanimonas sp. NS1]|nr:hypothetical protein [Oceanimonas sp. NS1]